MVFSSALFLFVFLPLFLAAYYAAPGRYKNPVILIGSYVFYAWWRVDFLGLLFLVTAGNHVCARAIERGKPGQAARRWMQIGVAANLLVLAVFKYFNFGVDSMNAVLNASGLHSIEAMRFILPIGISFYIFQAISYLVDVYRGDAKPAARFVDFAAYKALFPQLIAGPVLRYKDLDEQFRTRTHGCEKFAEGCLRFMIGFSKKVLIADLAAPLADAAYSVPDPTMADAWLGALAYTVQLYFDFSGYSDMAVGLALMMGFRFPENFNDPYVSRSITEFWRRWHISLSTWLRDYLYIPLGGNRKGRARTYINLVLTMFLGGLWHGANWTFVLWGLWHGGWMAAERACGIKGDLEEKTSVVQRILKTGFTFLLVVLGWVMFRAAHVGEALDLYRGMIGLNGFALQEALRWQMKGLSLIAVAAGLLMIFAWPALRRSDARTPSDLRWQIGVMLVFILAVSRLLAQSYSPFLYFQF